MKSPSQHFAWKAEILIAWTFSPLRRLFLVWFRKPTHSNHLKYYSSTMEINISSGKFCLQGRSVCQLKNATWVNLTLALKLQKSVVKFIYLYFNTRSLSCSQKATPIPQTVRLYTWTPFMVVRIYHKRLGSPWLQFKMVLLTLPSAKSTPSQQLTPCAYGGRPLQIPFS